MEFLNYLFKLFLSHKPDAVRIYSQYTDIELSPKIFLFLRLFFTPYQKMAAELPHTGRILDQGCGHGLFSVQLALASKERFVIGIDHDENRIDLANSVARKLSNLEFYPGSFTNKHKVEAEKFEGVALIDVLHYFSKEDQYAILKNAYDILNQGGTVVFREVNPNAGLISKINFLWEKVATFSKFTKSKNEVDLTFRMPSEWEKLLSEVGFQKVESKSCSSVLFADVLFKGVKVN